MRFSFKVFAITIVFLAVSFSIGCYVLINSVFQDTLNQEIKQSLNENKILGFAFETAVINLPSKYEKLNNDTIMDIAKNLESSDLLSGRYIRISDEDFNSVYENMQMNLDNAILKDAQSDKLVYKISDIDNNYYMHSVYKLSISQRVLYIESLRNISGIFEQRQSHFTVFQQIILVMILVSSFVLLFITSWLTRPISKLSRVTRVIAKGDLNRRVKNYGDDEIGQLSKDFNLMADSLQDKVIKLQETARQQEDFVGSFSHELKTPLTSIIGYADMLRSRQMDEEKQFIAANYIFNEGKRLESLSLTLLDMIILGRKDFDFKNVNTTVLFNDIAFSLTPLFQKNEITLTIEYDKKTIVVEPDLIKSLLINLLDNARKASASGQTVIFTGKAVAAGYLFQVKDSGVGIPEEHLNKITEAFYVVDKSRAKSQNGTGLGLALCVEIANLHGGVLEFESNPGQGTTVSFLIKNEINNEGAQYAPIH